MSINSDAYDRWLTDQDRYYGPEDLTDEYPPDVPPDHLEQSRLTDDSLESDRYYGLDDSTDEMTGSDDTCPEMEDGPPGA